MCFAVPTSWAGWRPAIRLSTKSAGAVEAQTQVGRDLIADRLRAAQQHDRGHVEHLAGAPGHPDDPATAVDLEELVRLVVAGADGHLRRRGVVDDAEAVATFESPHRGRRSLREEIRAVGHDGRDVADLTDPEGGRRVLVH